MHLLYADDSGSVKNPTERHFVLAGVCAFERRLFHLINALDDVVRGFNLGDPDEIELHGSPMYNGRGIWESTKRSNREGMIQRALGTITHGGTILKLFAVVVEKHAVSPRDPLEVAFEELSNRFNLFLQRLNNRNPPKDAQKGLIIIDENDHEQELQALARLFRINGATWGHFHNLAEVPLFVDSRASRAMQLADLVAWATFRKYEFQDGRFFDSLIPKFDADGGVIHGLVHRRMHVDACYCPACSTRNARDIARDATLRTYPTRFPEDGDGDGD